MTVARPPPQVDCSKCGADGAVAPKEKEALAQTAEVAEQTALRIISAVRRPLQCRCRRSQSHHHTRHHPVYLI